MYNIHLNVHFVRNFLFQADYCSHSICISWCLNLVLQEYIGIHCDLSYINSWNNPSKTVTMTWAHYTIVDRPLGKKGQASPLRVHPMVANDPITHSVVPNRPILHIWWAPFHPYISVGLYICPLYLVISLSSLYICLAPILLFLFSWVLIRPSLKGRPLQECNGVCCLWP